MVSTVSHSTRLAVFAALLALSVVGCSVNVELSRPEIIPVTPAADQDEAATTSTTDADGQDQPSTDTAPPEGVEIAGRFSWEETDCDFEEPSEVLTTCGWLKVPERWDDPGDKDIIRLHVGVFSMGPTEREPIIYLEGGPGGDALANIGQAFGALFGQLVADRDLVVIGQRGTGSSEPHLQCENVLELELELLDDTSGIERQLELAQAAYATCADRFRADGIDLSAFNSVQNAHDVEALRMALGFKEWNVLGISYGTRLAQTLMRLHPEGIRAVVLDSVLTTERDPHVDQPVTAKRAFETLFGGCADSQACTSEFGDLEARYFALVDRLDTAPVTFEASDMLTGDTYPAALDGLGLIEHTFGALYSRSAFSALPELVEQLESGDTSGVASLVNQSISSAPFVATGMFWSVECNEEVPFITAESERGGLTGDPRYDRISPANPTASLAGICRQFDSGVAPSVEDDPVVSDLPVLVLAGSYDPVTPPADGASLLDDMSAAFFFEYPHTGHAALVDECAQSMVAAFMSAPSVAPDARCIADITEPDWRPDIFASIEFEPFSFDSGFFSASGVVPSGWDDLGDGTFALSDNLLHSSVIVQQAFAGVPVEALVENVGAFIGGDPVEVGSLSAGGHEWTRFEADIPGSIIDLVVTDDDGTALFVVMQHAPADHQGALDSLLPPILEALGE